MEKVIPKKNYIILILLVLLVIAACFAFVNVYNIYQTNKISESPLGNKSVLYSDLGNAIKDLDADTFLVISYLNDQAVYNNENVIKRYLQKKNYIDNVLYLNATEYKEDETFINDLNNVLKLETKIEKLPALVFYKSNIPIKVVDSKKHLLNKNDFESILKLIETEEAS